jgi:hypothetical protein
MVLDSNAIDPLTSAQAPFITGLKTAIDVLPIREEDGIDYLVLQHASVGLFFGGPGLLLRFQTPGVSPSALADCLTRPTSMALDEQTDTLYMTELAAEYVLSVPTKIGAGARPSGRFTVRTSWRSGTSERSRGLSHVEAA